jgi:nucleoside-diphosphate-sugar epimerase
MSNAPSGSGPVNDRTVCLVTGATGFIGTALVDRLRATGASVRRLARTARGSGTDDLAIADLAAGPIPPRIFDGIDTVYHLAAKTHDVFETDAAGSEYWSINVEGTERLLESTRGRGVRRVVFVSSVKAQAEQTPHAIDETYPAEPTTPYGRSKLAAERLVLTEAARRGFEAVCVRFPLVYGPGQRGNLVRMIAAIDRGRFPPLPAGNRRSMLHVENAVEALMLAGRHPAAAGRTYTVTDAVPYSTREIYDLIRKALGKSPVTWSVPEWAFRTMAAAGDGAHRLLGRRVGFDSEAVQKLLGSAWYSAERITRELGYRPTQTLAETMPALIAEYRAGLERST